jgi:hypothetical protein
MSLCQETTTSPGRRNHALTVVSYAGNVGHAQGLETILEGAQSNHIPGEVRPVLIGDGVFHDRIVARV